MTALYTELDRLLIDGKIDEEAQESYFLPLNVLDEKVTRECIRSQLNDEPQDDSLYETIFLEAKKVFAILGLIGHPLAIKALVQQDGITDEDLPLIRKAKKGHRDYDVLVTADRQKSFRSFASWEDLSKVKSFLSQQWAVQAPVLDRIGQHLTLDNQCPFPFTESTEMSRGGSGVVYRSKLHSAHQKIFKAGAAPYIAVKQVDKLATFEKEKENLEKIQRLRNKHLIKLIATCTKKPSFYFIFPWADGGNLKDFWKLGDSKPRTPALILWSLQQMLGIVDGLRALHAENGRHGDFKPQNILHFTEDEDDPGGHGILVIADVGVSKFHKEATSLRHVATAAKESTVSYEAPEAEPDRLKGLPRPRRYDMWSIGCMFLEYTIWLVYSYNAVRRFRGRRTARDDPTTAAWTFFTHNNQGAAEIHDAVADSIRILLQDQRCKGTALGDLVMLIKDHLLQIDVQQRSEAPQLYEKFEKIVRTAEKNPSYLCKRLASPLPTPHFFRSRKDSDSSMNSSSSDLSTSQDVFSIRSASSDLHESNSDDES